jgi:bifunctional DNA-binding transcriptional regulator/antitoxin component of YhaV-PrlF toxin-antitoxin module
MPLDFLKCIKDGGKVVTKKLDGGKYIKLCKDKSGKWHKSEVHRREDSKGKSNIAKAMRG